MPRTPDALSTELRAASKAPDDLLARAADALEARGQQVEELRAAGRRLVGANASRIIQQQRAAGGRQPAQSERRRGRIAMLRSREEQAP
jgi:hypothetical protein